MNVTLLIANIFHLPTCAHPNTCPNPVCFLRYTAQPRVQERTQTGVLDNGDITEIYTGVAGYHDQQGGLRNGPCFNWVP